MNKRLLTAICLFLTMAAGAQVRSAVKPGRKAAMELIERVLPGCSHRFEV